MKINDASRSSGLSRDMIRYYEKIGLLSPSRLPNGYRDYTDDDLYLLTVVKYLSNLGVPLKRISKAFETGQTGLLEEDLRSEIDHLNLLKNAQGMCDKLIVGVTVDELVSYKGKQAVIPFLDHIDETAEAIGGQYVLSRKPNPANVAVSTDPDIIREEIGKTVQICLKYRCPCDITLKDISTVGYKPQNLIVWAETASSVLDEFYGEA